jgi:hypothetical protein
MAVLTGNNPRNGSPNSVAQPASAGIAEALEGIAIVRRTYLPHLDPLVHAQGLNNRNTQTYRPLSQAQFCWPNRLPLEICEANSYGCPDWVPQPARAKHT